MQHYSSQALTDIGMPAAGATVTVKLAGSNTNATIYSDDGITVKSNPFVSNNLGQFDFYTASGKYDITVTGTQITTYTLPNQVVFDPFEQTAADTALAVKGITAGNLISGSANPAATGLVRAASADILKFRNNANSADVIGLQKNSSDVVQIGDTAGAASVGPFTANGGLIVAAGQVIVADQVMPINSAGVGGFWGWSTLWPQHNTGSFIVNAANEVRVYQFVLPYAVTVNKVTVNVSTSNAGTADVGIYSTAGSRLIYTNGGINTGSQTTQTVTITGGPVTLTAGSYYLAQTSTSTTATLLVFVIDTGLPGLLLNNAGFVRVGVAANTASAGVLPATLGVVSTSGVGTLPIQAFFER